MMMIVAALFFAFVAAFGKIEPSVLVRFDLLNLNHGKSGTSEICWMRCAIAR